MSRPATMQERRTRRRRERRLKRSAARLGISLADLKTQRLVEWARRQRRRRVYP